MQRMWLARQKTLNGLHRAVQPINLQTSNHSRPPQDRLGSLHITTKWRTTERRNSLFGRHGAAIKGRSMRIIVVARSGRSGRPGDLPRQGLAPSWAEPVRPLGLRSAPGQLWLRARPRQGPRRASTAPIETT